ncbi:DUF222 domain-containing protein [Cellulomonas carbonis]|uniref:HNH nuclease domain-containing protein n=1 Tax=Cellulomonas carbonis T26 TaxID=947969 RepID=A0A0A0BKN6_9CELL|nr:DUF222 domain-containing protein [Cellulomonas carbonis]KGM08556.1 hypothetical protein N868_08770 [Cellulomonas carbonis T26]GGC10592.1 hypothetical protein GCM10010972_24840 [Cellulomonas carbonis]
MPSPPGASSRRADGAPGSATPTASPRAASGSTTPTASPVAADGADPSGGEAARTPLPAEAAARTPLPAEAAGRTPRPVKAAARTPLPAEALDALLAAEPSGAQADELAAVDLGVVDDARLAALVAAWDKVASWVAVQQAATIHELARREPPRPARESFAADEVACELAVTRRAAQRLVDRAWALADHPDVRAEAESGRVSIAKVDAMLAATAHLRADQAAVVHARVLPRAAGRTVPQVRSDARAAEQELDPAAATARHELAAADRAVWLRPAPDSMTWVTAYLPAPGAAALMTALDALAAAAAPEDGRGVDARRADALTDLARTVLDRGTDLAGAALPTRHRRRPHLQVTMTLPALCGASEAPAELAGYGPVPAALARRIAVEAAWTFLAVDPATGQVVDRSASAYRPSAAVAAAVLDRDVTCTFPGCAVPASRCDLDHIVPFDPDADPARQTRTGNLAALCRHHHRLKTHGAWTPSRDPATGVTTWTSPTGSTYTRDPHPVPWEPEPLPRRDKPRLVDADDRGDSPRLVNTGFVMTSGVRTDATGGGDGSSAHVTGGPPTRADLPPF